MKHSLGCILVTVSLMAGAGPAIVLAQANPDYDADSPTYYDTPSDGYDVSDPWEGFNRNIHEFNEVVDRYALKPVAQFYRDWVPDPVSSVVTNFFSNLEEPINLFNNLAQLKGEAALTTSGRLVFNTTFGLAGLFDVATFFELPEQEEDFGQTLGYWGVAPGPFVVLPFLGPSTVRDTSRYLVDSQIPTGYDLMEYPDVYYAMGLRAVDLRARLIPAEQALIGEDRYRAIRNAYLQQREFQVNDGRVEDPFAQDDEMLEDF